MGKNSLSRNPFGRFDFTNVRASSVGPTTYSSTTPPTITVGDLRRVDSAEAYIHLTSDGTTDSYVAKVANISGTTPNLLTIRVYETGAALDGRLNEAQNATLSSFTIFVDANGY